MLIDTLPDARIEVKAFLKHCIKILTALIGGGGPLTPFSLTPLNFHESFTLKKVSF